VDAAPIGGGPVTAKPAVPSEPALLIEPAVLQETEHPPSRVGSRAPWLGLVAVLVGLGLIVAGAVSALSLLPVPTRSASVAPTFPARPIATPAEVGALAAALGTASDGVVRLRAGTYTIAGFGSDGAGETLPVGVRSVQGAGIGRTVLQMPRRASHEADAVPTRRGTTNQLSVLKVTGSPALAGFTLQGTDQGHLYNGLRVHRTSDARISDVLVAQIPGDDDLPPGETFAINDYRTTGSVYRRIEVDGRGVGASGFATNSSTDVTVRRGYFHDERVAHGATFWQTNTVRLVDVRSVRNAGAGLNFERDRGVVTLVRPALDGNAVADLRIASDTGRARFRILDPVLTGGAKLTIDLPATYNHLPNRQRRTDVQVLVHGADRTAELVRWVDRG
jgi:hypothetical protein